MSRTCLTGQQLSAAVAQSHRQLMRLGEQEVQAIQSSDLTTLADIEGQLREAHCQHDADMAAFKDHVVEHDCL
jgi:hypothetical protein